MKKILFFLAAATAMLVGCSKSELDVENTPAPVAVGKSFVGTFAMNEGTKTTVKPSTSGEQYLVYWESGDEIKVKAGNNDTWYTFTISELSADKSQAVFTCSDPNLPENFFEQTSYTAKFGAESTSYTQISATSVKHLPMEATAGSQRLLNFKVSVPVMAVTIPSTVKAKSLSVSVRDESTAVSTIKTSGAALSTYYIPVPAKSEAKQYNISAFTDNNCSTKIAESMKMQAGTTMVAGSIYPFTFCPTLEITSASGDNTMKSYPATYNVRIMNAITSGTVTLAYDGEATQFPATVDINAKGFAVSNLVINTPSSHVDIANGSSTNVTSKTSLSTLVVKPTFTITKTTVEEGSIRVEGQSDGSRNVDEIVLNYANKTAMEGTVISVAEVTKGTPVLITNETTSTGSEPITVVGKDNTESQTNGGYQIEQTKKQNITTMEGAVAKIGTKLYASLEDAAAAAALVATPTNKVTITLVDDIKFTYARDAAKTDSDRYIMLDNVTLDLDGHTISSKNFAVVYHGDNMTIKNGNFAVYEDPGENTGSYSLFVGGFYHYTDPITTNVVIEDVTCTGGMNFAYTQATLREVKNTSSTAKNYYAVYSNEYTDVTIESGKYTSYGDMPVVLKDDKGTLTIKGGAYTTVAPKSEYIATGYKVSGPTSGWYVVEPETDVVATIGTEKYATLAAAFEAVQDGQTITLVNDCETGSEYNLGDNMLALTQPNVTLDLNGCTVTETNNFSWVIAGDNDVVKNGSIVAGYNSAKTCKYHSYALVVGAKDLNSSVTGVQIKDVVIKGGLSVGGSKTDNEADYQGYADVTLDNCNITSGDFYAICVQPKEATEKSKVTINSGTYTHSGSTTSSAVFDVEDGCSALLYGGTYSQNPKSEYIAPGYSAVANGTNPETWTVKFTAVAQINDNYYYTLKDAFAAVQDDQTITLVNDCETGSEFVYMNNLALTAANVILDLNGHTLTTTNNMSTFIAGNNDVVKNGKIYAGTGNAKTCGYNSYAINVASEEYGTSVTGVKFQNVEFKGGVMFGGAREGSKAETEYQGCGVGTIEDCTIKAGDFYAVGSQISGSSATVLSGVFNKGKYGILWAGTGCTISLKGGTYDAEPLTTYIADGYEAVAQGTDPETWKVQEKQVVSGTGTITSENYNGWSSAINVGDKLFYLKLGTYYGNFNYYAVDDNQPITVTITETEEASADMFLGATPNVKYYNLTFSNLIDGDNPDDEGAGSYKEDPQIYTSTQCKSGEFGIVKDHPTLSVSAYLYESYSSTLPDLNPGYGISFWKKPAAN